MPQEQKFATMLMPATAASLVIPSGTLSGLHTPDGQDPMALEPKSGAFARHLRDDGQAEVADAAATMVEGLIPPLPTETPLLPGLGLRDGIGDLPKSAPAGDGTRPGLVPVQGWPAQDDTALSGMDWPDMGGGPVQAPPKIARSSASFGETGFTLLQDRLDRVLPDSGQAAPVAEASVGLPYPGKAAMPSDAVRSDGAATADLQDGDILTITAGPVDHRRPGGETGGPGGGTLQSAVEAAPTNPAALADRIRADNGHHPDGSPGQDAPERPAPSRLAQGQVPTKDRSGMALPGFGPAVPETAIRGLEGGQPATALDVWLQGEAGFSGALPAGTLAAAPGHGPWPSVLPQTALPELAAQIGATLAQRSDGTTEFTLSPEELGKVRITLQPESPTSDRVIVMLSFDRPETLDLFRRHADQLSAALQAAGYAGSSLGFAQSDSGNGKGAGMGPGRTVSEPLDDHAAPALGPPPPPRAAGTGALDLRL